jgi:hypothetical protein
MRSPTRSNWAKGGLHRQALRNGIRDIKVRDSNGALLAEGDSDWLLRVFRLSCKPINHDSGLRDEAIFLNGFKLICVSRGCTKNISVFPKYKSGVEPLPPHLDQRGVSRSSRT